MQISVTVPTATEFAVVKPKLLEAFENWFHDKKVSPPGSHLAVPDFGATQNFSTS